MAGTTPLGLPLFDQGSVANPLSVPLNALSNAMDDVLQDTINGVDGTYSGVRSWTSPPVGSAAERNLMWPAPIQGNRVYRTDKAWEEAYFEAYHAVNNPGGAQVAGWYPVSGAMPFIALTAAGSQSLNGTVQLLTNWAAPGAGTSRSHGGSEWFTYSGGIITVKVPGYYNINAITKNPLGTANIQQVVRRTSPSPVIDVTASPRQTLHSFNATFLNMPSPGRIPVAANEAFGIYNVLGSYSTFFDANSSLVPAGRFVIEWAGVFR